MAQYRYKMLVDCEDTPDEHGYIPFSGATLEGFKAKARKFAQMKIKHKFATGKDDYPHLVAFSTYFPLAHGKVWSWYAEWLIFPSKGVITLKEEHENVSDTMYSI